MVCVAINVGKTLNLKPQITLAEKTSKYLQNTLSSAVEQDFKG